MAIYYVYMRWGRESDGKCSNDGRLLLTFESRYVADELFRALQAAPAENGKMRYTLLERKTPQFWVYDSIDSDPWWTLSKFLRGNNVPGLETKIMYQLLDDANGAPRRGWPTIPVVEGPDWVHNRAYFIRNKRQPHLYWHHFNGYILISDRQKTKFRIRNTDLGNDKQSILIRSDRVEISLLDHSIKYIYLSRERDTSKLVLSWDTREWKFGDLLGSFGTTWETEEGIAQEYLTLASGDDGDEWELC